MTKRLDHEKSFLNSKLIVCIAGTLPSYSMSPWMSLTLTGSLGLSPDPLPWRPYFDMAPDITVGFFKNYPHHTGGLPRL